MRFEVVVYYKGGGTATYHVSALSTNAAKWLGRDLSGRWEPNLAVTRVTAKRMESVPGRKYGYNPQKPFGDPFDDIEDVAAHPRSVWFA